METYRKKCISAQQLNRVAASVVDSAIQAKKEDVARLIGRDGVAGAWEINTMVSPYREVCKKISSLCGDWFHRMTTKLCW